jgi:hypothetical protein
MKVDLPEEWFPDRWVREGDDSESKKEEKNLKGRLMVC